MGLKGMIKRAISRADKLPEWVGEKTLETAVYLKENRELNELDRRA